MRKLTTRLPRGAILGGAVSAFARLGFAATRVEDILEAAGISRRTFYKYFSSKEDVLAAVYELATSEILRAMRSFPSASSPAERLRAIRQGLDIYLDYHVENAQLVRVLVEQAIRSDSPLFPARQRFRAELTQLLDDAVRASTGEAHDPMLYAALISALEGVSLDMLATGVTPEAAGRAKCVMNVILTRVLTAGAAAPTRTPSNETRSRPAARRGSRARGARSSA
jgi:AcrR family transcriptional regulator